MRSFRRIPLFLMLAVAASAATEDDASDYLQFMAEEARAITVASHKPETVLDSVSNVTVIDRRTIERYDFANVADALQTVAGVMVWRTYAMQHVPVFRGALQEHYANKVLVMIDNVPAWNAVTGECDLDRVGIDSVERIEILRGPASVLYGSNALNGAINIVLRRPAEGSSLAAAAAGVASGHGGPSGAAEVSRVTGVYARDGAARSLFLSADYYSWREPAFAFSDETGVSFRLREYLVTRDVVAEWRRDGHVLLANVSSSVQDYGGNNISLASGGQNPHDKEMELVSYSYAFHPSWGDLKYAAAYDRQRRQIPRDAGDDLRSDILGTRYVNSLSAGIELPEPFSLEVGVQHEYRAADHYNNFVGTSQAVVSDNGMDDREVWEGSIYAQLGYERAPWKLLVGSRYTHNEAFGGDLSSRASAVYRVDDEDSVKLMAGQSFRAPTPFELYFLNNPATVVGNPGLRPEKTSSAELSYQTLRGRLSGQAAVYYERYEDSIFRNLGNFTRDGRALNNVNFYDNAPAYDSLGAELELRYEGERSGAFAAFDYIHGSRGDEHSIPAPGVSGLPGGTSSNFKYVPRYVLSVGASRNAKNPFGAGEFFGSLVANHFSSMDTLRTRLPNQAWSDLSIGFKKDSIRHTLSIRNVTGASVDVPEHVRQRVVESMPLVRGRRLEYTVRVRF